MSQIMKSNVLSAPLTYIFVKFSFYKIVVRAGVSTTVLEYRFVSLDAFEPSFGIEATTKIF